MKFATINREELELIIAEKYGHADNFEWSNDGKTCRINYMYVRDLQNLTHLYESNKSLYMENEKLHKDRIELLDNNNYLVSEIKHLMEGCNG